MRPPGKCIDCQATISSYYAVRCVGCSSKAKWGNEDYRANLLLKLAGYDKKLKGKPMSEEQKKKISFANKGKKKPPRQKEHTDKIRAKQIGRKMSDEQKLKISIAHKKRVAEGKCNFYKDGEYYKKSVQHLRNTIEYRMWRDAVFKRDNWKCVMCGAKGGNGKRVDLNADHIKPFALFPDLRFDISNGRTLCVPCHSKTDTFGHKIHKYAKLFARVKSEELKNN